MKNLCECLENLCNSVTVGKNSGLNALKDMLQIFLFLKSMSVKVFYDFYN